MGWMGVFFLLKLKRIKCCPIPYRLPSGSSANLTARRGAPSLMGRTDGTDGTDGNQKCPLIFFILRYEEERHGPDRRMLIFEGSNYLINFLVY